jgi:CRP/FNR family transcriptional regulator
LENNANNASLFDSPALAALIALTPIKNLAAGESLFQSGEFCTSIPVILSGSARIYTTGDDGRKATLYRLKPGDVCPLSLSALLQHSTYPATATAETASQVRYLAGDKFKTVIRQSPDIFGIFLDTFAGCLYNSLCTARQLIFDSLDIRLAHLLNEQFSDSPYQSINLSDEDIANELGTTPVVASSILKKLEHADCIRLSHTEITLHNADALKKLVNNSIQLNNPA